MRLLKKHYGFWFYLIVATIITAIVLIFVKSSYGVNDDFFISAISNGVYGEEYSQCLIYSSSLLGWVIRLINLINNNINWYVLIQYGVLVLSSALLSTVFSKKTNCLLWGLVSLFVFYILIYFDIITRISFKTTSKIVSIVGLLCLIVFTEDDEKQFCILSILVSFIGFVYRKESFLLVCPFAAFYFIYIVKKSNKKKQHTKTLFKYTIALAICIACSLVCDANTYKSDEWQEFLQANKYRSTLQDYPNNLQELSRKNKLDGVNLTNNDIDLFLLCKNDNAEKFGSNNLGKLVEMTKTAVDDEPISLLTKLKDFYLATFKPSFAIFYIIIIELIILLDSGKIPYIILLNMIASMIIIPLCYIGRFPTQVAFVIYSSIIVISTLFLAESLNRYTNKKLMICLCVNSMLILSALSYKNIKKYHESIDYFDYANNSGNKIYVVDVLLLYDSYFQRYSPWRAVDKNIFNKTTVVGGWMCPSPLTLNINKKLGYNNSLDIIGKDANALLFINNFDENIRTMEKYLKTNYDSNKHLECENNTEDIWSICKFTD